MIQDALDGKIDLIITKSVSRFARNTVDSLTTVRKLKEKGVEIYFEKENIWTLDSKGELLITIMSSLAQEESRSISENCKWGIRKRFADGKLIVPYGSFLGYEKGPNGTPVIVEEEAEIVRFIYNEFLYGSALNEIGQKLTAKGIKTKRGSEKWSTTTLHNILTNEKYTGNALLQKTYTTDFLTKIKKKNEGEVPQYYVENSHPAIISMEIFNLVQEEIQTRSTQKRPRNCFAGKVFCGQCGGQFGSKIWHSNDKYRCIIWRCNDKYAGRRKCTTGHVKDEELQKAFVKAFNKALKERQEVGNAMDVARRAIFNTAALEEKLSDVDAEIERTAIKINKLITINSALAQNPDDYEAEQENLFTRYEELQKESTNLKAMITDKKNRETEYNTFTNTLASRRSMLEDFDEFLFRTTVSKMIVHDEKNIEVIFKDGSKS